MRRPLPIVALLVATGCSSTPPGPSMDAGVVVADLAPAQGDLGGTDSGPPTKMLTLIAGGLGGPGTTDGIGPTARFRVPSYIVGDGAGNAYITDEDTVRKLVLATGAVTTLAGQGETSGSADGTGAAATFHGVEGIAYDAGNLYVADSHNDTIRKIVIATGAVTTLAGSAGMAGSADGTGAAATFDNPDGLAVDGAGNLYVADLDNDTIRKVVLSSGAVTTIAGTAGMSGSTDDTGTAARFTAPHDLVYDGSANLYIADANRIRQLVVATGVVTTLAGSSTAGSADGTGTAATFNQAEGLTLDGSGNLYVVDYNTGIIRKIVLPMAIVTTLAGGAGMPGSADGTGAAARFNHPLGVLFDGSGNLYIADSLNAEIRKLALATSAVTTSAGLATQADGTDGTGDAARFDYPQGMVADSAGNLYVADCSNDTIRKVVLATGATSTIAGTAGMDGSTDGTGAAARFSCPGSVALDGAGNLYVADYTNDTLRKMVLATGAVTTFAGAAGVPGSTDGTGTNARFSGPYGFALDGAGNLYVAEYYNDEIRKVVLATAAVTTLAGSAGNAGDVDGTGSAARLAGPSGDMAIDGAGNMYFAEYDGDTVRKVVLQTGAVSTVAGSGGMAGSADGSGSAARFDAPGAVALDGTGGLLVADSFNGTIRKIVLASGAVTTVAGTPGQVGVKLGALPAGLNEPWGLVILPNGSVLLSEGEEDAILAIQ